MPATKLHELNHWTGKAGRVERPLLNGRNSHAYAFEELVAEIGSALEGAQLGLPCDIPNHASYLAGYVDCLKADKRAIFRAASLAQKVADYVLAFRPDYRSEPEGPVALADVLPRPSTASIPEQQP